MSWAWLLHYHNPAPKREFDQITRDTPSGVFHALALECALPK